MRLLTTVAGLRCYLNACRSSHSLLEPSAVLENAFFDSTLPVGLVPTMGALHAGHLSLMHQARRETKIVVVSIFVNPLQFGPAEDLQRYPRSLEQDRLLCEQSGVDVLFVPDVEEMGVGQSLTQVLPPEFMLTELCGRSRLGHFQGVATIVTKLLNIVQPTRAYFGQKDAQQLAIIQRLVMDLNLPIEIVGCPIIREADGLALSSRNQYLSGEERKKAATIYRGLQQAQQLFRSGERKSSTLIEAVKAELRTVPAIAPEYIELVNPETMETLNDVQETGLLAVAARLGSTRLIDNILLSTRQPIVAIDGPAGAGKSTVARQVAQTLGLLYLDTGAMYRALTWLVLQSGIAIEDEPAIAELLSRSQIELKTVHDSPRFFANGQDVTTLIRSLEVTARVSEVAAQPAVRQELVRQQQIVGRHGGIVIEGRDIGTHVFPDAEVKIFLTASVQERARRRQHDLKTQGIENISLDELEQTIFERDRKDSTRLLAPLRQAADATEVNTDGFTIQDVVNQIVTLYYNATTQKLDKA